MLSIPIATAADLKLDKGDHICLVGNALCERMQHHNDWESLLYQRFPDLDLVVRNLGFPGDEPFERIRSENFGDPDRHLAHSEASVVMYFFGFNESFAGEKGLEKFAAEMTRLVEETKSKDYGAGPPDVVLVSPIAFENTGDPNLPNGEEHNARLAMYTEALAAVAEQTGVVFVDVFTPTLALFEQSDERLTLNGCHLNEAGYAGLRADSRRGVVWSRWPARSRPEDQSTPSTTRIFIGGTVTERSTATRFTERAARRVRMEPTTTPM